MNAHKAFWAAFVGNLLTVGKFGAWALGGLFVVIVPTALVCARYGTGFGALLYLTECAVYGSAFSAWVSTRDK